MGRKAFADAVGFAPGPHPCQGCPKLAHCTARLERCAQYAAYIKVGGDKWQAEPREPSRLFYARAYKGSIESIRAKQAKRRQGEAAAADRTERMSAFMLTG